MSSVTSSMATDSSSEMRDTDIPYPKETFRTENLWFSIYKPSQDSDCFRFLQSTSALIVNSCASILLPMDLKYTSNITKEIKRNSHMFVIVYEPLPDGSIKPIGILFLESSQPDMAHHRCSKMGIGFKKGSRGFETEAIHWTLNWAFDTAGLHRVEMNIPSWNTRFRKVFEEIGFHTEGERRECYFKNGEWWGEVNMSMLSKDWKQCEASQK